MHRLSSRDLLRDPGGDPWRLFEFGCIACRLATCSATLSDRALRHTRLHRLSSRDLLRDNTVTVMIGLAEFVASLVVSRKDLLRDMRSSFGWLHRLSSRDLLRDRGRSAMYTCRTLWLHRLSSRDLLRDCYHHTSLCHVSTVASLVVSRLAPRLKFSPLLFADWLSCIACRLATCSATPPSC